MVRGIHNLTKSDCVAHIKKCKKLGITKLLCDGGGLYLRATATGAASWLFGYEIDGIGHEHGLGSFWTFELDEAREKARRCRQLRAEEKDPIAEHQAARNAMRGTLPGQPAITSKSFKYCTMQFIAFSEANWSSDKHRRDWEISLVRYAYPVFDDGRKLVSTITMEHVLAILQPHWVEHTETMKRVRGRIENVLDWAKGKRYRSGENPARWKGNLDAHLNAKVRKETEHFAALEYDQLPALVAELQAVQDTANDALLFCLLTAGRSKEVRLAKWSELNFVTNTWTVPAARMKAKLQHRVPLTETAIALLRRQPTFPRPGMPAVGFVFCNSRGVQALGEGAMLDRLQQLRPGVTVHGSICAGFSTWAADVAKARIETREAALAHSTSKVIAAYRRSDLLTERRELMTQWEQFCLTPIGDNVTPLRREAV